MKKKAVLFEDFPQTIYIVHHDDSDNVGYELVFKDEVEAAEDANANDSKLAEYFLEGIRKVRVDKTVVYE